MTSVEQVKIPEGYKQTEVGVIPEDWSLASLSEVSEVRMCKRILAGQTRKIGAIPFFKIGTFGSEPDSYIPKNLYKEFKEKFSFPKNGDVLISAAGTLGKTVVYDGKPAYFQDSNIVWLEIDKNKLINEYLYHYYKVIKWASSEGSTIARLYNSIIGASRILLPPVKEQIVIANALSDVDSLIVSLETLIAKKSAIKTAAMQQLLTGKKRLPAFAKSDEKQGAMQSSDYSADSGSMHKDTQRNASQVNASQINTTLTKSAGQTAPRPGYKQTELGEIPEDWEVVSYDDSFKFLATASNSRSDLTEIDDISYIHYGDIHTKWDIKLDFSKSSVPKITQEKIGRAALLKDGDVIMADASEDYSGIGKSIEIKGLADRKAISGLHTFLLRDKGYFVDGFRGYLHLIEKVKNNFDRLATGLKVYGLSKNSLKEVLLPVPPKEEQTAIANVLSDMDTELDALQQRLSKTQKIKQGMMQELLTGKTRLV